MRNLFSAAEKSILTGLLVAYTIHNLAVFDSITSYILFATVLAYIIFREQGGHKKKMLFPRLVVSERVLPFLIVVVAIIVLGMAWRINATAFAANRALFKSFLRYDTPIKNLMYLKQAIAYGSYGTEEARLQLSQVAFLIADTQMMPNDIKQAFFSATNHELLEQSKISPLDARYPLNRGILLAKYGNYTDAMVLFQHAHELSPKMQDILFAMAMNAQAGGDFSRGTAYYKEAYLLDPSNAQAKQVYLTALQSAGKVDP